MLLVEYVAIFLASVALVVLACWVAGVKRNSIYWALVSCLVGGVMCVIEWGIGHPIEKSTIICSGLLGLLGNLLSITF